MPLRLLARGKYLSLAPRTCQVFLESDEPIAIYADGKYLCETPADLSIRGGAARDCALKFEFCRRFQIA